MSLSGSTFVDFLAGDIKDGVSIIPNKVSGVVEDVLFRKTAPPAQRALPDHEHAPSFRLQRIDRLSVACGVRRELGLPKGSLRRRELRQRTAMSVPEAAVDEYSRVVLGKD